MNHLWTWLLVGASVPALAQQSAPTVPQDAGIMVAAVSRDQYMFTGGLGPANGLGEEPSRWNLWLVSHRLESGKDSLAA